MKKRTVSAFTLVEMLIVIVIIGILIAALMPRMQAAQGRARDVSRKTALSQVQSAIVTAQGDNGQWPGLCDETRTENCATGGISLRTISGDLITAGMNSVPLDPLKSTFLGVGNFTGDKEGYYGYMVTKRNGAKNGGFVLMAKTEVEGGSNRVVCSGACTYDAGVAGCITGGTDISKIRICDTISKTGGDCTNDLQGHCEYKYDSELRYIVTY